MFASNTLPSFADGFGPPLYKLTHNPTICVFEPPSDSTFSGLSNKLISHTQYSVIDWQTKLNAADGKHPHWNMNFIKISLNQQPSFDISQCDITIHFKAEPDDPNEQLLEAGVTKPDYVNHKADIEIYYLGVNLKWQTDTSQQGDYILTVYTPVLYFTGFLASDPQIGNTIRHEIGHALGLPHYILPNDVVYKITKGELETPSIMITTIIGYGVTHFDITPNDIKEIKAIYGNNGFSSTTSPPVTPPAPQIPLTTSSGQQIPPDQMQPEKDKIKDSIQHGWSGDVWFRGALMTYREWGLIHVATVHGYTNMPSWFEKVVYWWANGDIQDEEFISTTQYLLDKNILQV